MASWGNDLRVPMVVHNIHNGSCQGYTVTKMPEASQDLEAASHGSGWILDSQRPLNKAQKPLRVPFEDRLLGLRGP